MSSISMGWVPSSALSINVTFSARTWLAMYALEVLDRFIDLFMFPDVKINFVCHVEITLFSQVLDSVDQLPGDTFFT